MIFKSIVESYERLAAQNIVPAFGSTQEKIGFCVVLDRDGNIKDISNLSNANDKKSKWMLLTVPSSFKRSGISPASFFLWDKAAFVFGVEQKVGSSVPTLNLKAHKTFKTLHQARLADSTDEGLVAMRRFLENWKPAEWASCEFLSRHAPGVYSANFVFRLDGELRYVHERPAARELVERYGEAEEALTGRCLVTGQMGPIARLHPAIKGVYGSQMAGASIVSFQMDSASSYGKERGANAPVSVHSAFAYTTVLNHLLLRDAHHRQCVQVADTSVVFWAEAKDQPSQEAAETLFFSALEPIPNDPAEAAKLKHVLDAVAEGRAVADLDPRLDPDTKMFVLGLAPNASRLSIRYWFTESLDQLTARLAQHYEDLSIEPVPWKTEPAVWRLLSEIAAQEKSDNIPPQLGGSVMRAVLGGGRYPRTLLSAALIRMRADGQISGLRVAICKAVLTRDLRLGGIDNQQEIPVSLDKNNTAPGYLLGRLFSVLEGIQEAALGKVNASIKDRYYGSASAMPAGVFPLLLRGAQNHLSKGMKLSPGLTVLLEKEAQQIIDGLGSEFPKTLSLESQGRFAIGYYHQRSDRFRSKSDKLSATDVTQDSPEEIV